MKTNYYSLGGYYGSGIFAENKEDEKLLFELANKLNVKLTGFNFELMGIEEMIDMINESTEFVFYNGNELVLFCEE